MKMYVDVDYATRLFWIWTKWTQLRAMVVKIRLDKVLNFYGALL